MEKVIWIWRVFVSSKRKGLVAIIHNPTILRRKKIWFCEVGGIYVNDKRLMMPCHFHSRDYWNNQGRFALCTRKLAGRHRWVELARKSWINIELRHLFCLKCKSFLAVLDNLIGDQFILATSPADFFNNILQRLYSNCDLSINCDKGHCSQILWCLSTNEKETYKKDHQTWR